MLMPGTPGKEGELTCLPFQDAAVVFLGRQVTFILKYFLSRNIGIARERV
jgi:hypothetical protein